MLSTQAGKEAYIEPIIANGDYSFVVRIGKPKNLGIVKNGTSASNGPRSGFVCLMSGTPIDFEYIRKEGRAGRLGARLLAIVADGRRGRVYLDPLPEQETIAKSAKPTWTPQVLIEPGMSERVVGYGFTEYGKLFTDRQLVGNATLFDLLILSLFAKRLEMMQSAPECRAMERP